MSAPIRVGVGGWDFEPWRETFFPAGLPKARRLHHASRALTTIEVNGTFYRTQKPETFAAWAAAVPDGFLFSLKAPRYVVQKKRLGEAGELVRAFIDSGIAELGPKLGPILWQFADTKVFDADDLAAFLDLLPERVGGLRLMHVLEPRHPSFRDGRFGQITGEHGVAVSLSDSDKYLYVTDVPGPVFYARMQRSRPDCATGYPEDELDAVAAEAMAAAGQGRAAHVLFINGAKERAPAAAQALIARLPASHRPGATL